MKIEYTNDVLRIVPEDIRDEIFMKSVLGIDKGKVFCKVVNYEGKWEDQKAIEITVFDDSFKSNFKHEDKKNGYQSRQDGYHGKGVK